MSFMCNGKTEPSAVGEVVFDRNHGLVWAKEIKVRLEVTAANDNEKRR